MYFDLLCFIDEPPIRWEIFPLKRARSISQKKVSSTLSGCILSITELYDFLGLISQSYKQNIHLLQVSLISTEQSQGVTWP